MITIIDYGVGNIGSISNMLEYLGVDHSVAGNANELMNAERLLLPGVGSYDFAMNKLLDSGLTITLNKRVLEEEVPILGICLGMQLMCQSSEEGKIPGLGWFDATVHRFDPERMGSPRPIPHMGWNEVEENCTHPILEGLQKPARFYFAHSYHTECRDAGDVLLRANYGYSFTAAIAHANRVAVQFHPEKSHKFGLALLSNFAAWNYAST